MIPYPLEEAPSQRFRFEQYLTILKENQFKITLLPFLNQSGWKLLYSTSHLKKNLQLIKSFLSRPFGCLKLFTAEFVFIHREIAPIGPPVFEWIIAKILKKKIIYDFDDAIWFTDKKNESLIEQTIRWRRKVSSISKWSHKVSCGNEYLRQYAALYNSNAILNPTTIDTGNLHNPSLYQIQKDRTRIIIGWTGSHSTLKYLYMLQDVLRQIQKKFIQVDILVIADEKPAMNLDRIKYKPWSRENEIKDLMLADIGIMPLPDNEWAKGKCGFKALQYMALEIPTIISPIGVNKEIIQHELNGFLCSTDEEWLVALEKLIRDATLRKQIGKAGKQTVISRYSVSSNSANFLSLFE